MPGPNKAKQPGAAELKEALAFGTDHLSLYQLTIEPETPFAAAVQKRRAENSRTKIWRRSFTKRPRN